MRETIPPLPQYVYMAWCLVKDRITLLLPLYRCRSHKITSSSTTTDDDNVYGGGGGGSGSDDCNNNNNNNNNNNENLDSSVIQRWLMGWMIGGSSPGSS
jgi:hypothetical protein